MVAATETLQDWVQDELFQVIDWGHWLETRWLDPEDKGSYFQCKCPGCGKAEAVFYPNRESGNPRFECNRKNECAYSSHVLAYVCGQREPYFPTGEIYQTAVKELADSAGMTLPEGDGNYQPAAPRRRLLNDYWGFLKSRFKGSAAEKYVRDRGLDPDKHEFGLFPESVNDVLEWAANAGWTQQDLEEANLIKEGAKNDYVFCWERLAGAFKDHRGDVFNIWGRDLTGKVEGSKKYLNLSNSTHAHKKAAYVVGLPSDALVWCEGYLDACALSECGYRAAATGTNTISDDMWSNTRCKHALLSLDTDAAGRKGALSFLEKHLNDESPAIWFVDPKQMQGCKDLAELYQKHGKAAVDAALDTSTWIHRDKILADLLMQQNSTTPDAVTDFQAEQISLTAYELDKRLSPARCPSFEKHFWRPLCEKLGFDLDTVKAHVDNARERRRREQALNRITSHSSDLQDALSKGDVDSGKLLQEAINHEWKSLEKQDKHIRDITIPYTREAHKNELASLGTGLKTGLNLDGEEIIIQQGAMTIVAAATNHGKTTVIGTLALNILENNETAVLFITLELPRAVIINRLLNTYVNEKLSANNLRSITSYYIDSTEEFFEGGKASDSFKGKEREFWGLVESRRLITVAPDNDLQAIVSLIETAIEHTPNLQCVVIDYIQLIDTDSSSASARHEEIKEICNKLLHVSIELGIAIICAAQFNREVQSVDHINDKSLGEGGSIERFADQVIGLWNHTFDDDPKYILTAKITKLRNGVRRKGKLLWNGNIGIVENELSTKPNDKKVLF